MLFGARALQGAFAAVMAPGRPFRSLTITFQDDPKERAKAFGAYGAVSGAGGAIGVLAGGILTQYASWRWCLLVNVPIAILAALPRCGWSTRAGPGTHSLRHTGRPPLDCRPGQPGVRLHQGGVRWLGIEHHPLLLGVAVVLLVAFVLVESRSRHPLLPLRVVSERNRAGAYLAALLTGAGLFAMFVFLSYYMQGVLHYSALKAGVAFLPFAAGLVAGRRGVHRPGPQGRPSYSDDLGAGASAPWDWRGSPRSAWHTSYWTHVLPPEILMSFGLGACLPRPSAAPP